MQVDESYLGGVRKSKRGRGAAGKVPVFGLLTRGGKVFTVMSTTTLMPIMTQMIRPDGIVYADSLHSCDALGVSEFHHVRINHSQRFVDRQNRINGIGSNWS